MKLSFSRYFNEFAETFKLLDLLTDGFLDHLKNNPTTPFKYSTIGVPFQLSELQQKAIDIFK